MAIAGHGLYAFCPEGYIEGRSKAHWTSSDATGGYMFKILAAAAAVKLVTEFPAK